MTAEQAAAAQAAAEIIVVKESSVAIISLNRPKAMNALNHSLMRSLSAALDELERDNETRAIVITGGPKVFAAGADIKEMENATVAEMTVDDYLSHWDRVARFPKPVIAAVGGAALGGGCELALACDLIVAGEHASFGQPEILIGVIPGAGGTQRLTRILGKQRAMELILTGRRLNAREALAWGLVNRVAPAESFLDEAKALAKEIAAKAPLAARLAKSAVLRAQDGDLAGGVDYERRLFWSLFATEDQKEGMKAFSEKRAPLFKGK